MTALAVEDRWSHDPDFGVGILTGTEIAPSTHLVAIDIDIEDGDLIRRIAAAVPGAPAKKGKKGITFFARSDVPLKKKILKVKNVQAVEVHGTGQQVVLPPSIHPDTGKPYEWLTAPLQDFDPQELPVYDMNTAREVEVAVKHPGAKWWGILDMKPATDGEPGSIHNTCVEAVASMVAFKQPEDWIKRRIMRAMEEVDVQYGYRDRDYDREQTNIEEWIRSSLAKGHDEIEEGKKKSPYVTMSDWIEQEWYGPGSVFINAGMVMIYKDGHYQSFNPEQFRHALTRCGNDLITGLQHRHLMELAATALDRIQRFPMKPARRVCLLNGTYDMDTGELLPWSKDDFLISQLDFAFDPNATCPQYVKFLEETFAHEDPGETEAYIAAYEEFVSMTFFECHDYQRFLVLEGATRSGKGVLAKIIKFLHPPDACCSVMAHHLDRDSSRTSMLGKLINVVGEANTVNSIADEYIKTIVAGEPVEVRHLYHGAFSAVLPVRLIIATNEPLKTKDTSGAVLERMLLLKCDNHVPREKRDVHLIDKLQAERPGIFNRMARAWLRLKERGRFEDPKSLEEVRDRFAEDNNPVLKWVRERTVEGVRESDPDFKPKIEPAGYNQLNQLYIDYVEWAKSNGFMQMNIVTFGTKLGQIKLNGEFLRAVNKRIAGGNPIKVRKLSLLQPQRF